MPALEPLAGLRVVAAPAALDEARWTGDAVVVLRFAPDEAFVIGASGADVADKNAILEPEAAFVGSWCARELIERHVEWPLPDEQRALAQGKVAGVPAKVWLDGDQVLLVTHAAYAEELETRLGWRW